MRYFLCFCEFRGISRIYVNFAALQPHEISEALAWRYKISLLVLKKYIFRSERYESSQCFQHMPSVNPLASLTRVISMGNVYMKTKRKARYWKNITIIFIFWPFFQACLTNLFSFIQVCGFKYFFPYRKLGLKFVYMSSNKTSFGSLGKIYTTALIWFRAKLFCL